VSSVAVTGGGLSEGGGGPIAGNRTSASDITKNHLEHSAINGMEHRGKKANRDCKSYDVRWVGMVFKKFKQPPAMGFSKTLTGGGKTSWAGGSRARPKSDLVHRKKISEKERTGKSATSWKAGGAERGSKKRLTGLPQGIKKIPGKDGGSGARNWTSGHALLLETRKARGVKQGEKAFFEA